MPPLVVFSKNERVFLRTGNSELPGWAADRLFLLPNKVNDPAADRDGDQSAGAEALRIFAAQPTSTT